jgi:hypothetical protein
LPVLDELRELEQRIVTRLRELQPLVDEHAELQRAASRLGIDPRTLGPTPETDEPAAVDGRRGTDTRQGPVPPAPRAVPAARRPGGTRAAGAERRELVVSLIREHPGVTVTEISRMLGLDPPPVYRTVRKLLADRVVVKRGTHLDLTPAAEADPAGIRR